MAWMEIAVQTCCMYEASELASILCDEGSTQSLFFYFAINQLNQTKIMR